MKNEDIIKILGVRPISILPTGSKFICTPPVLNTDEDWVVLLGKVDKDIAIENLLQQGYVVDGGNGYSGLGEFISLRSSNGGNLNLILTSSSNFYCQFKEATELATLLNLTNKKDRKTLFQYVLYGKLEA